MAANDRVDARKRAREAKRQQRAEQLAAMSEREKNVWALVGIAVIVGFVCLLLYACQPGEPPKPNASNTDDVSSTTATASLTKLEAIDACKEGVLARASHPSTVAFPALDYDFRSGSSGDDRLLMSASAKNGFGLQLEYNVQCNFSNGQLREVIMSEARSR